MLDYIAHDGEMDPYVGTRAWVFSRFNQTAATPTDAAKPRPELLMPHVMVRCYAELNDYLPGPWRQVPFVSAIAGGATVDTVVRSLGVPIDEVDLVLVNGESAPQERVLHDGDALSVYPVFESFDVTSVTRMRERPLRVPRFVLDVHLGKLAHHLRMLGIDTAFNKDADDAALVAQSLRESRALLSKDKALLDRTELERKYHVRERDPRLQLLEVLGRFDLYGAARPWTRCIECNTLLQPVPKEVIRHRLPENVDALFQEFQQCPTCDRVYWKGSHYERMQQFVHEVLQHRPATGHPGDVHAG